MTQRAFRSNWDGVAGFVPPYGQPEEEFAPFFANSNSAFNPPTTNQPPPFHGYHNMGSNFPYMMPSRPEMPGGYYTSGPYANGPMKVMGPPPPFHAPLYQHHPRQHVYEQPFPGDSRFLSSTENIPQHSHMHYVPQQAFHRHSMPQGPHNGHFPDVGQWNAQPMGANDNVWRDPDELRRKQEKLNGTQVWGNPDKQKNQSIRRWTDGDKKIVEEVDFAIDNKMDGKDTSLSSTNGFGLTNSPESGDRFMGWGETDPLDKDKLNKIWVPHPAEMIGQQRLSPDEPPSHHHHSHSRPISMVNPPTHQQHGNMWATPGPDFNCQNGTTDLQYHNNNNNNNNGMHEPVNAAAFHAWRHTNGSRVQSPRLPNFDDSENFTSIPDLGCNVEHLLQEDRLDLLMKNVTL
ncbi:hypothetical protein M3Y94_00852500 [Aphelenchoides besseyi]|nr:hypothetical protein M3Y94_00852500 [Aphelenchoides besseyi]KAI6226816.1 hypothetical protein M3Y95_00660800 [Aphelenchoides besseyi]